MLRSLEDTVKALETQKFKHYSYSWFVKDHPYERGDEVTENFDYITHGKYAISVDPAEEEAENNKSLFELNFYSPRELELNITKGHAVPSPHHTITHNKLKKYQTTLEKIYNKLSLNRVKRERYKEKCSNFQSLSI